MNTLSREALNRAFLARQSLLAREKLSALEAVERLVGLQAQAPAPPYFGLWCRLEGFRPEELGQLLTDRRAVRIVLMRSTVHLVSARDCQALRPWIQPALERGLNTIFGKDLAGLDLKEVAGVAHDLMREQPRSTKELGRLLQERWPDREPSLLVNVVRVLLPVVQVPPRGVWGLSGTTTYAHAEDWLGARLDAEPAAEDLVLRYLAAFGPATVKDIQTWSGLTRLRVVAERLRPRLAVFRDDRGDELLDLPDAPRPDPDTPAPVRFLAPFDNAILSHADRGRIINDADRPAVMTKNGLIPGTVLVDGFVRGIWRIDESRSGTSLTVQPFAALTARQRAEATEEGHRLLEFAAPTAGDADVRFAEAA